jgi:hypothetical protein
MSIEEHLPIYAQQPETTVEVIEIVDPVVGDEQPETSATAIVVAEPPASASPTITPPEGKTWHPARGWIDEHEMRGLVALEELRQLGERVPESLRGLRGLHAIPPPPPLAPIEPPAWARPVARIPEPDPDVAAAQEAAIREEQARIEAQTGRPLDGRRMHREALKRAGLPLPYYLQVGAPPEPTRETDRISKLEAEVADLQRRLAIGTSAVR